MRRIILLLAALALVVIPAGATAHRGPAGADPGTGGDQGERPAPPPRDGAPFWAVDESLYMFHGEVEAVDAGAGTLDVTVHHVRGPGGAPPSGPGEDRAGHYGPGDDGDRYEGPGDYGNRYEGPGDYGNRYEGPGAYASDADGDGEGDRRSGRPEPFDATFHADADTGVYRNGEDATLADLQAGDIVAIAIVAEPGLTPEQAATQPAWMIAAHERPSFYGFGGRVTGIDEAAGTITLAVRWGTRNARRLLVGSELPRELTFAVSDATRVRAHGGLEEGDVAGVGVVAPRTATLEEILATPAEMVIGLSRRRASTRTMARLGTRAVRGARAARR